MIDKAPRLQDSQDFSDKRFAKGEEWLNEDSVDIVGREGAIWVVDKETPDGKGVELKNKREGGTIIKSKEALLGQDEKPVRGFEKPKGWQHLLRGTEE